MMVAGLFTSCTTDDLNLTNENNSDVNPVTVVPFSDPVLETCTDPAAIGGTATLSSYTGPQITFTWNNAVEYDATNTYVAYIEIAEDAACPAPAGATPVAATYPIDVFNTSSFVLPTGVSAKCFNWRIVINAYQGEEPECTVTTDWKPATYVQ